MEWVFNGLGTALIGLIIGVAGGGAVGYHIGIKKNIKQSQKAGDNSQQVQIGGDYNGK
jgi:Na+/glutamate symporter